MAEKVSTDLDGKIEGAMPKEDADQTPKTDQQLTPPSFAVDPAKAKQAQEKRQITTLDVLLYLGKQLKEIKEQNKVLTELLTKTLEKLNSVQPTQPPVQPVASQPVQPPAPVATDAGLEKVKVALADYLKDGSLTVDDKENTMFYIVRSTKFLGTDNFAKIAGIVRGLGGEYVSQGKASHFKIPKGSK